MTDKTNTTAPEALRLAAWLQEIAWHKMTLGDVVAAGRELRRQHARIAELEAELEAVGGVQALSAAPAMVNRTQHNQFLSDVLTAAGLVTHGKQCKALGERLGAMVMRLRAAPQQEAQEPFTKAQQERLYQNRPDNVGRAVSLADWRRTVEFIEAAHGITQKGGS